MNAAIRIVSLLLVLVACTSAGPVSRDIQAVAGPRVATDAPSNGRYAAIIVGFKSHKLELRLDRITGRTWTYNLHEHIWDPVPAQDFPEPDGTGPMRFQIVSDGRLALLLDTTTGDTWRYDHARSRPGHVWTDPTLAPGTSVEGWHRIDEPR